jgi:hypothetical protein
MKRRPIGEAFFSLQPDLVDSGLVEIEAGDRL